MKDEWPNLGCEYCGYINYKENKKCTKCGKTIHGNIKVSK